MKQLRNKKRWLLTLTALLIGIGCFFWGKAVGKDNAPVATLRFLREPTDYSYINPLLGVGYTNKNPLAFGPLQGQLTNFINTAQGNGSATMVSVFISDIQSGNWTGVNEDQGYNPASLLKVPIMMAALKKAETDPGFLSEQVKYEPPPADLAQFGFDSLTPGTYYTVNDLIKTMIAESDNGAKDALGAYIDTASLQETFTDLSLPPLSTSTNYLASPRAYSRFFRILYNATYLDQPMSEYGLSLLSQTHFDAGLVGGIPTGIPVAHKFGQYADVVNGQATEIELHDCGIVYDPSHPYILCVMTQGNSLVTLEEVIAGISRLVYTEAQKNYQ